MQESEMNILAEKYTQILHAKFTEEQVQVLMSIWAQAVSLHPEVATKTDLKAIKADMVTIRVDIVKELKEYIDKSISGLKLTALMWLGGIIILNIAIPLIFILWQIYGKVT